MSIGSQVLYLAEPPAQYLFRPPVVIDCSVFAALVFLEIGATEALARMSGKTLNAPYLLPVEMTSVAQKKLQHGPNHQDDSSLARQGLLHFEEADITYHEVSTCSTLELAARYQLTAYDATYLCLAAELKCPLLTFDMRLAKAAKTHLALLP